MHHKAIKAEIRKQLKIRYRNWHRLTKKEMKTVAKKVLDEVVANYDFKQEVTTPVEVLLGIETQLSTAAIMDLFEFGQASPEGNNAHNDSEQYHPKSHGHLKYEAFPPRVEITEYPPFLADWARLIIQSPVYKAGTWPTAGELKAVHR